MAIGDARTLRPVLVEPDWRSSLDALLWRGEVSGANRFLGQRALPLLASGAAYELGDAIATWPPSDCPLVLRLVEAAARFRADPSVAEPAPGATFDRPVPPAALLAWETGMIRAYFGWRRDLAAGTLVADVQATLPAAAQGPLDLLGRSLNAGGSDYRELRATLAPGFAKLAEAGLDEFDEWRLLWSVLVASMWSRCTLDDFDATVPSLRADAAELAALGSPYAAWAWAGLGFVELLSGDVDAMALSMARAASTPDPTGGAVPLAHTAEVLAELFTVGPSPSLVDDLIAHEAMWRRQSSVSMVGLQGIVTTVLLDHRWVSEALDFTARAGPGMFLHRELFTDRATLITTGDPAAAQRLLHSTDAARRIGWGRWATAQRLRVARDCLHHGLVEPARALRAAALAELAASTSGPTRWETELLAATLEAEADPSITPATTTPVDKNAPRPGDATAEHPPPTEADAPDAVLVLQPGLVVRRHGLEVAVSPQVAQLLALLVVERRPVTTDFIIDALWPSATVAEGRDRLKRLVYRVRQALAIQGTELIVRRGDGLELVPGNAWYIDAWSFWDTSRLLHYGADLCDHQFAYDDALTLARFRFATRWVDLAAHLIDDDPEAADPVEVAARARRFGLLTPELAERLAAGCRARGRPVEASSLLGDNGPEP